MPLKYLISFFLSILIFSNILRAQDDDAYMVKNIHNEALSNGKAYDWLHGLCKKHGVRIAGSKAYLGAANYTKGELGKIAGVNAYLQPCEANYWQRGKLDEVSVLFKNGKKKKLNTLALGNSVATPKSGINGEVIEVNSLDDVEKLAAGGVVAVKGIGGYHLAVDATSEVAVGELRHRKRRDDKPFQ